MNRSAEIASKKTALEQALSKMSINDFSILNGEQNALYI